MKISSTTPTPPPAPTPIDPGQSSIDYIDKMADPVLQQKLFDAEKNFRPGYDQLNIEQMQRYLQPSLDMFKQSTEFSTALQNQANSAQRESDIRDVENMGGRAAQAFRDANPELQAQLARAQGLSSSAGMFSGLSNAIGGADAANSRLRDVISNLRPGEDISQGLLGNSLYSQAMAANGLGGVGQQLQNRASALADSRGQLTPDELRSIQQSTREAYAARGTEMGSGAVNAEALGRLTNERQRMQEDLSLAAQINAQSQGEIGANRNFAQGVYGQDQSRQFANRDYRTAFDQQQVGNNQLLFNNQQQLFNNQGVLAQFNQSQLGADRGYALQLAQAQAAQASDPFQAILGRSSGALQYGAGQQAGAQGMLGMQGPQLFDPNAGVNLALQNSSNLANYNSSIYGAQTALAGANAQARGAMLGGLFSGLGAIGGGFAQRR